MSKSKLLFVFFLSVLVLSSCSDDTISELETQEVPSLRKAQLEKDLANYPSEINIDNWEEFVHAPKDVIEHFDKVEKAEFLKAKKTASDENLKAKGTSSTIEFGFVEAFNGNWQPISGVNVTSGGCGSVTNGNSPVNYIISSSCLATNPLCMAYDTPWINGVSTFDLVLIQRHILGIQPFTEARQFWAADVNGSGTVTTLDLIEMKKLILFINVEFPSVDNVIFVPTVDYLDAQAEIDAIGYFASLPFYTNIPPCLAGAFLNRRVIKTGDVNGSFVF